MILTRRRVGISIALFLLLSVSGWAQVRFTLNAPAQVAEGNQFRVTFSVNAQGSNLKVPPFSGFSVLSGPNQSQSSSTQIINGQVSSQVDISYSYILQAAKIGKYTIGQASIVVNGQTYKSAPQTIEVVKGNPRQAQQKTNNPPQEQTTIAPNDLFLRAIPSKTTAYQGEEVLVLYKLYFTVPIVQYGMSKLPSSTGFWSNELTDKKASPRQYSEAYNGRNYNVADLRKIAVYPQKSGRLTINPLNMDLVAQLRQQRQHRSIWDDFFSDPFQSVQNIKKVLNSNSVNIQVLPFPEPRPAGFNGAVGNFNVTCSIDKSNAKTNDAILISLTVKGKGNLNLLEAPTFEFPADFEVYDPKIKDNIVTSLSGISGSRTFEYLVIPRNPGKFTIKSIDYVSFNPATKTYSTYKTPTFSLDIEKGNGYNPNTASNLSNQKEIKYLGSDIRFIKKRSAPFTEKGDSFFLSIQYILIILGISAVFVALVLYFRNQITMRKDLKLMRNKRASKLARKRLTKASKFMKEGKKEQFFTEISQVIWGFVADKCNIPISELSMESIRFELEKINTDAQITNDFATLLHDCEFARFAPGDPTDLMQQFYDRAFNSIITLEKQMKNI